MATKKEANSKFDPILASYLPKSIVVFMLICLRLSTFIEKPEWLESIVVDTFLAIYGNP